MNALHLRKQAGCFCIGRSEKRQKFNAAALTKWNYPGNKLIYPKSLPLPAFLQGANQSKSGDCQDMKDIDEPASKSEELRAFFFLTAITAPVLAVAVVGGYGFMIWMYQLFTGRLPTG